ncbi:hypothetical protein C9374_001026 [Naegleria lovaniensis]|uniref:CRAL-TRIO domain-containing protein n=1 Tax=Naegleria lovaniensis TaxID=51637 RepID=A0AA88GY80_NAELO|nr:uncharacterized protein C9374_001026 [Naegleria lovaniensis]KAG2388176.1 hypothetical protein C9374_001026 [Naegleria lovaniensis]
MTRTEEVSSSTCFETNTLSSSSLKGSESNLSPQSPLVQIPTERASTKRGEEDVATTSSFQKILVNDSHAHLDISKMELPSHGQLFYEWKKVLSSSSIPPHVFVYGRISREFSCEYSIENLTVQQNDGWYDELLQVAKRNQFLRTATDSEKECFVNIERYVLGDEFLSQVEHVLSSKFMKSQSEKMIKMDLSLLSSNYGKENHVDTSVHVKDLIDDYGLVLDVFSLLRFCHARKFDVNAVKTLIHETIAWRLYKKPHLITKESVQREYSKMKGFWLGYTKQNSPIIYIYPQNHVTYDRDFDECINYTLYMGEFGMQMIRTYNEEHVLPMLQKMNHRVDLNYIENVVLNQYVEQYTIVYDGRTVAMKNFDLAVVKEFLTLSSYYAERMKCVMVYNPNWSYKVLMKMVNQFLDKKTADKIKMVYNMSEVDEFLDVTKVPRDFGGQLDYKFH